MIFLGVWILLFVSTTLKEVVTQEIKESIEQEVFDRLSVIEKITLRNEKKTDKILDLIYEEQNPPESPSYRPMEGVPLLGVD